MGRVGMGIPWTKELPGIPRQSLVGIPEVDIPKGQSVPQPKQEREFLRTGDSQAVRIPMKSALHHLEIHLYVLRLGEVPVQVASLDAVEDLW